MKQKKETIYLSPYENKGMPLQLQIAGITHADPGYFIKRPEKSSVYVLEYVVSGKGHVHYGEKYFSPEAGDVYFLQPNAAMEYYSDRKDPWQKVWFNLDGPLMQALCDAYNLRGLIYYPGCPLQEEFFQTLETVRSRQSDSYSRFTLQIHDILLKLHQWKNRHQELHKSLEAVKMRDYIATHYQEKLSIQILARLIGRSPSQVQRIFRRDWGESPCSYWQKQRIFFACQYLENSDQSIKSLAQMLGFADEFYFSNWFKKQTGSSPLLYRRRQRS